MKLPDEFLSRTGTQLCPNEFGAFLASYRHPPVRGIRFNRLKTSEDLARHVLPIIIKPKQVPWCREGYSFIDDARLSKHIMYHAGLFYIQEPSAMCPVEVLEPLPGERVLDLCAAPGGKSVQIAGHMNGRGLLVSNDRSASRCRGLVRNIELAGARNVVVLSEDPTKLAARFPLFFDRVLVDAPCSGEGMFRRDKDMSAAYAKNKPEKCQSLQKELLYLAAKMLGPGGCMVYSTCTFNRAENEDVVEDFLARNSVFRLGQINHQALGVERSDYGIRIWPHKSDAEGHFAALLINRGEGRHSLMQEQAGAKESFAFLPCKSGEGNFQKQDRACVTYGKPPLEFAAFMDEHLLPDRHGLEGYLATYGENLYLLPEPLNLDRLRVARSGLHLGTLRKGRFVPSQALALALFQDSCVHKADLSFEDAARYLKGESIPWEAFPGGGKPWVHVCCMGLPLGFARYVNRRLKNCLPRGWVGEIVGI